MVKNGGSNLVLTNVTNDFTGGLYLNQGTITITSTGAANNLLAVSAASLAAPFTSRAAHSRSATMRAESAQPPSPVVNT